MVLPLVDYLALLQYRAMLPSHSSTDHPNNVQAWGSVDADANDTFALAAKMALLDRN